MILQVIPFHGELYAEFKSERDGSPANFTCKIICLALIESDDEVDFKKYRYVEGMYADSDEISLAESVSNFAGYRTTPLPEIELP